VRLRIAVHPASASLFALSRRGTLERLLAGTGDHVEWVHGADRRQTAGLLADDEVDLGGAGALAPIHAQAAGADVVYVAHSLPRREPAAIVTLTGTGARRAADLAGRRVALLEGSTDDLVLAGALAQAGLRAGDVVRVNLARRAGQAALARGAVEAWVAGSAGLERDAPGLGPALGGTTQVIGHRAVWFATRRLSEQRPDLLHLVVLALRAEDAWIAQHPDDAAALFAEHVPGDAGAAEWRRALARNRPGPRPISAAFVAEQQRVADLLAAQGLIGRRVAIRDALPADAALA
jgi:sulfonate transport system substrate-binding protein